MKKFGQHFLINENICDSVSTVTSVEDCNILEVGPGVGALTRSILQYKPKKLLAVEIDNRLECNLKDIREKNGNFEYVMRDITKYDLSDIYVSIFNKEKFKIIANLPYNIGTRLLISWYEDLYKYCDEVVLMLQEEVVDRICSLPNCKSYGRLSVLSQYVMNVQKSLVVDSKEFHKPPKVSSAVFHGIVKNIDIKRYKLLHDIVSMAFHNRRKILKLKLSHLNMFDDVILRKRAEDLSLEDYLKIVDLNL